MGRDKYPRQSLGTLHSRIKQSRILMVGAGGIGCELLKNLVLTGFGEIHVVDLDTIDLSNLNRQFLFRHEHIKKSKALVAKESAGKFNPNVKIEAYHANIKDPQFNVDWFKSFAIVFNALDNLDARRHVNRMCLAADVPLIESGTTGFNGQVQVIKKGKTECYDCAGPRETPKSFPVCTIRSTPSQPIHCIVWAKSYLFTEIFGTSEDEAPELDHSESSDNAKEIENLQKETQALKKIRESMGSEEFPRKVFEKVFKDDIERLRSMEDMWKNRRPPEPLDYDAISQEALGVGPSIVRQDQVVWTVAENFAVFLNSLRRLSDRLEELRANADTGNAPPILTFDKDDEDTLDFVAASANLRSHIFGIETRSKFDIKQMAGNIIPAIATTNAMTAGLCVLQAFKVMRDDLNKARMVFLVRSTDRVIGSEVLRPPRPDCPVCSVVSSRLEVDASRATLGQLVDDFLRMQLGYGEEFSVSSEAGILYDPELDDNLSKSFSDLGLKNGSFITIVDEEDESPRVDLVLSISEQSLPDDMKPIHLAEKLEIPRKPKTAAPQTVNGSHDVAVTNGVSGSLGDGVTGKRKRDATDAGLEDEQIRKRGKVAEEPPKDDDVVVLEDSTNGAIFIDDD
ncbi:E1 ubiquitin-activating protein uba2 [Coniosporium apollinis]|uniref:E1 ubiquitin-activating protein uba2 n=2 Tax=Coniosporium TaxID=2810619 RepID=A0ABQ9P0A8_9PEZI|nr:E1 ubiquitin-activating protein uba2 [Cladosporium sp. JES 115]KAJ9667443.1 E1 ubiquitin-activating protein uba2 [Coniosporium apollinis]